MATKSKPAPSKPAPSKTTAVANWDEELAAQAAAAQAMEESTSTGSFFSTAGGILSFNDAPMPNNEMAVLIADHILENRYYETAYDPNAVSPPTCFAFGRDDKTIAPHITVVEAKQSMAGASGLCAGCEMNEWGSANVGRGKACSNIRRLAVVSAGSFDKDGRFDMTDENQLLAAPIAFIRVPVTSVKGYAAFVKQVAGVLHRPPHGVFTRIKLVLDPSTQFKMTFEVLESVPNTHLPVAMQRHDEAKEVIEQPYSLEQPEAPARGGKGGKAQPPNRARSAPARGGSKRY